MTLENYIGDLLYRYDCVIVPNFGGFITSKINSQIVSGEIIPPQKKVSFNSHLIHNDGLLANHIVSLKNSSFDEAVKEVSDQSSKWEEELAQNNVIKIPLVGELKLNENDQIVFEPYLTTNFLTDSFGLSSVKAQLLERQEQVEVPVFELQEEDENRSSEKTTKRIPLFVRYAAASVVLLTAGTIVLNQYDRYYQDKLLVNQQHKIEKKIQEATFVISNPLPTIHLETNAKQLPQEFKYHIVAGAFRLKENAEKKLKQLQEQGFNAQIIGTNKWGLTQVSYNGFSDKEAAEKSLREIQKNQNKDAWLLTKE